MLVLLENGVFISESLIDFHQVFNGVELVLEVHTLLKDFVLLSADFIHLIKAVLDRQHDRVLA